MVRRIHHGGAEGRAFWTASGTTSEQGRVRTDQFARRIVGLGLWSVTRAYPMKSTQNAGSGSTVYGMGGWTSNNVTLVNGPTWGADGITYASASSHHSIVTLTGLQSQSALDVIARLKPTSASAAEAAHGHIYWFGDVTGGKFAGAGANTGGLTNETWHIGTDAGGTNRRGTTAANFSWEAGEDFTEVIRTNPVALWKNKAGITLDLTVGASTNFSPAVTTYTTDDVLNIAGAKVTTGIGNYNGKLLCYIAVKATLSDAQREAATDLVNAL